MGNDLGRNKVSAKQLAELKLWLAELHKERSQHTLSDILGISQSLISDIKRNKKIPSLGTLQLVLRNAKKKHLIIPSSLRGTIHAVGRFEGSDHMEHRGRALDILGAAYDDDFSLAMMAKDPPPRSESWILEEWIEYLAMERKAWRLSRNLTASQPLPKLLEPGNPPSR